MKVKFSKAMSKLTGKIRQSTVSAINAVIDAKSINEISNCKKIESLNSVYRIRIGEKELSLCCIFKLRGTW